jgi:hypothetical protein
VTPYTLLKILTDVAFAYETAMVTANLITHESTPTISKLVARYPWLGAVAIGGLALHLYWPDEFKRALGGE